VTRALAVLALATAAAAQTPRIAAINFYGLHRIPAEKILGNIKLHAGDHLPASKGDIEEAIERIPGVVTAHVEAACCEGTEAALFIGIEERGAPHFALRSAPSGDAMLPATLADSYHEYLSALGRAAARGNAAAADAQARAYQEQFAAFAATNLQTLRDVLRNSAEPEQRAIAATVLGYYPNKRDVVNDLQYAIDDPDESVRANAMHALTAIAVLARKQPSLEIRIAPTWFVEALHSVVLSDRMESVRALTVLTDKENRAALDLMRARALQDLVEMARWKTLRYALPPFVLVGRIAGLPDAEITSLWEKGQRENAIAKVFENAPARR
jgi:hypothetical protein